VRFKNFLKTFYTARFLFPKFYSQTGEDMILNQMLGSRKGVYIDIGSGRPIWYSNTYYFYRRGWSGVLIDPIWQNIKYSRYLRPRDIAILGVVADKESDGTFYEFNSYEYSTLDESVYRKRLAAGLEFKSSYPVKTINFDSIIKQVDKNSLIVLSIDTEGYEMQILNDINFETFTPSIILVEELKLPKKNSSQVYDLLTENRYGLYAFTGYTAIYTHQTFTAF
jgi:FkbM family methyltransferase